MEAILFRVLTGDQETQQSALNTLYDLLFQNQEEEEAILHLVSEKGLIEKLQPLFSNSNENLSAFFVSLQIVLLLLRIFNQNK